MDARLIFALGVSATFAFVRWRIPTMPKFVATFGIFVGIGLLVWAALPWLAWPAAVGSITLFAVGAAVLDLRFANTRVRPNVVDQPAIRVRTH